MVAVLGHIRDLGPLADRVEFVTLRLPGVLREPRDLGSQLWTHIGTDRIADPAHRRPAPRQQFLFIQGAVDLDEGLRDPGGKAATARSRTRTLPQPAGTVPSRNSS